MPWPAGPGPSSAYTPPWSARSSGPGNRSWSATTPPSSTPPARTTYRTASARSSPCRCPDPTAPPPASCSSPHARNRAHFTTTDRDHLAEFADHAGVALELDRARDDHDTMRQLEDHDRIAADLHDHVIQELFATGMGLQGMLSQLTRPEQRTRVLEYIDTLDATIRSIRNTIYRLHNGPEAPPSPRKRLLAVLTEQTGCTDLTAQIEFAGPLDQLPADLFQDVTAVLREALSNTVRHAHASTVTAQITLADQTLTVQVTDNGTGIGHPTRSSGLTNLRRRAALHDGTLHHDTPTGGGTHLTWTAHTPTHPTMANPTTTGSNR